MKHTAKLRAAAAAAAAAAKGLFQCFVKRPTEAQPSSSTAPSNDVNHSIIPETTQLNNAVSHVQSFDLTADDTTEICSVSSWTVVSDHA